MDTKVNVSIKDKGPLSKASDWTEVLDMKDSGVISSQIKPLSPVSIVSLVMDHSRITDHSIERILSPQFGPKPPLKLTPTPDVLLHETLGPFCVAHGSRRTASLPPFPQGTFYPLETWDWHYSEACARLRPQCADCTLVAGQKCQERVCAQLQQWKSRVRTVFTDSQLQRLEALFEVTRYLAPETRAEVARSTGLSEDTIRIWFKNHRARRKRPPQPAQTPVQALQTGSETRLWTSTSSVYLALGPEKELK